MNVAEMKWVELGRKSLERQRGPRALLNYRDNSIHWGGYEEGSGGGLRIGQKSRRRTGRKQERVLKRKV